MIATVLAILLVLFNLAVYLGFLGSVTLGGLAVFNMVVLGLVVLVANLPTSGTWAVWHRNPPV